MTAPPSPNNFNTSAQTDGVDLSWTYDNVWFGFDGDDGAISGFDEGRWLHPDNGIYVYYREKGSSTFTQYSEISIDDTSELITELNSDTTYEFKLRVYTSGEYSETGIIEETTYLNENRLIESHVSESRSFSHNERVSLEVVDQQIFWNEDRSYWYTNWFSESKILGNEDTLAIRSMVVPDAKQPAAIAQVEYDGEGNGKADAISEPVELGRHEQVEELHGIPIDEDGYYRIRITEYSGYNSLYKLDTAIVH
jgi:hypothetical protein